MRLLRWNSYGRPLPCFRCVVHTVVACRPMGCTTSKNVRHQPDTVILDPTFFDENGTPKLTPEAEAFLDATRRDPIAKALLDKWSIFVYNETAVTPLRGRSSAAITSPAPMRRENEPLATTTVDGVKGEWVNDRDAPMWHPDVDKTGRLAVQYIRMDMVHRGWKGTVKWHVEGSMDEGTLKVTGDIHSSAPQAVARQLRRPMRQLTGRT